MTRLVEAAEALARTRILTRPCAVTSAGTVRDSEVCTQCQRARTSAAGFQHAATCVVGQVMAACAELRGSGSLTVFSEAYARGWSDGQRRAIEQITGAQADAARRLRPSVEERAEASRLLEAVVSLKNVDPADEEVVAQFESFREPSFEGDGVSDFANMACRDLPEGWSLTLYMEYGSGDFTLDDPAGNTVDPEEYTSVDFPLVRRGRDAVAYAIRCESPDAPPAIPLTDSLAEGIQKEWDAAARRPEVVESDESWEASAALNRDRRVVCGRAIPVFGFAGKDVFTCDLAPGHGDAWHNDRTANKIWLADATEIHFHPNGAVETRLLGGKEEFDFSNAVCMWCGPTCYSGAAHNARVEADDRWNDQPGDREARGSAGVAR